MRFDDLPEAKRELLADAYREEQVVRLRAWIGVPICAAGAGAASWFLILADDSGYGGILGWPVAVVLGTIGASLLIETIAQRRISRMIKTFNLDAGAERELVDSLQGLTSLDVERRRARSEIVGELTEGVRRVEKGDWWGTLRK